MEYGGGKDAGGRPTTPPSAQLSGAASAAPMAGARAAAGAVSNTLGGGTPSSEVSSAHEGYTFTLMCQAAVRCG